MLIRELKDIVNSYTEDELDNEIFIAIGDNDGIDIIKVENGVAATFIVGKES